MELGVQRFFFGLENGHALAEIGFHAAQLAVDIFLQAAQLLIFGLQLLLPGFLLFLKLALKRLDLAGDVTDGILEILLRLIELAFGFAFGKEQFDFQLLYLFVAALRLLLPILGFFHEMGFERRKLFLRPFLAPRYILKFAFLLELPGRLLFLEGGMETEALFFFRLHRVFPGFAFVRRLPFEFFEPRLPQLLRRFALRFLLLEFVIEVVFAAGQVAVSGSGVPFLWFEEDRAIFGVPQAG